MRLAISDDRLTDCYKMLYRLLKRSQHNELSQKISFLEWHRERETPTYNVELSKAINLLKKTGFKESEIANFRPSKFDKEDYLTIEGKFLDPFLLLTDFFNEWKGKVSSIHQEIDSFSDGDFIILKDNSVEIYTEINLLEKKIYFRCWGEIQKIDFFLTSVKDWWIRETKERNALKVFLSYSHVDEKWKDALITSLGILKQNRLIKIWHDRGIKAGDTWSEKIEEAMNVSQLVFLLISPEFINSDYCYKIETNKALEKHERKQSRVIPIFVRETLDSGASYLHLQGFPQDKKPLKDFGRANTDNKGIQHTAKAISEIVQEIHKTGLII